MHGIAAAAYLLRGLAIERPDHVWCTNITYIPVRRGFLYLVAMSACPRRRANRGASPSK